MQTCWLSLPDNRPTFSELVSTMEDMLSTVSDYLEMGMVLSQEDQEYPGIYLTCNVSVIKIVQGTTVLV